MTQRQDRRPPEPGYHSHTSTNHLEFFLFDSAMCVPIAVVHWAAVRGRGDIHNDK